MTLSRPQVPVVSMLGGTSQIVRGDPPSASVRRSLPPAKKAIDRLSGDQNGETAPSVPAIGSGSGVESERTQRLRTPFEAATKTIRRPSGDTASPDMSTLTPKVVFAGSLIGKTTTG